MMAAFSYHGVGYMVYWILLGWEVFAKEMTDWSDSPEP